MIQLPRDAEGREIPLDTSELFIADGTKVRALRFEYMYHTSDARITCRKKLADDILSRIRKLRGEDDA